MIVGDRCSRPGTKALDPRIARSGRIHDYLLAGKDHYAADRAVGDQLIAQAPGYRILARGARLGFLRAVRTVVVEAGVRPPLHDTADGGRP
ncbi:SAM-dependent methyltransferase [Nocardia terpenica]|uniref:Uncharacterized protein n=1 Tax=Nocardia terpenica TaxID=455432 RepID=A0A6G9ZF31_9NOCA|nr:SAM-dependent methyltransferase [Nocardia terpenica]QIS23706.1 hypothetical protein F6W96_40940 [Nocardia terpenica]